MFPDTEAMFPDTAQNIIQSLKPVLLRGCVVTVVGQWVEAMTAFPAVVSWE